MDLSIRTNTILMVSIITVCGLILRLYFALTLPLGWDGGIFLYWANLINGGAMPYRDFFIRDPVYIYILAVSARFFGPTYFAAFLVSIIPGVATIPMIFKTTQEIFGKSTGLVAALAYAFSPTVIWYSTVIDERTLMVFLSVCALWILARGLKKQESRYFIAYGLILGVSTFAYRGIAIYIVTLPILLGYLYLSRRNLARENLRLFLSRSLESSVAYALAAGLLFSYFSITSSFSWMISNFGFGGQQESASYFIYGEVASLSFRVRVFDVFVREWLYLIVPAALMVMVTLLTRFFKGRLVTTTLAVAITCCFWIVSVGGLGYQPQSANGTYEPNSLYSTSLILFLGILPIIGGVLFPQVARKIFVSRDYLFGPILTMYWLLATGLLIGLFGVPLLNYYYYLAPIITILAAPALRSLLRIIRPPHLGSLPRNSSSFVLAIGLLSLLTLNAAVTTGMLLNTQMTWRNVSPTAVTDIASYIQKNTVPQDEILTGNPAIAIFAQRRVALGITQMQIYWKTGVEPFNPMPYDPFHLFPNVTEIAQFMSQGGVKFVIGDTSPPVLTIMSLHPLWEAAFLANFVQVTTIDGTPIFLYDPTSMLPLTGSVTNAYTNSTQHSPPSEA